MTVIHLGDWSNFVAQGGEMQERTEAQGIAPHTYGRIFLVWNFAREEQARWRTLCNPTSGYSI